MPAGRVEALTTAVRERADELAEDTNGIFDMECLDRFGVEGLFSRAGYEVYLDDDGFSVQGYLKMPASPDLLLPLLAAHAMPARADWVMADVDGLVGVDRFENGTYTWIECDVVTTDCFAAVTRAYRAIANAEASSSVAGSLREARAALAEALSDFDVAGPDHLLHTSDDQGAQS